MSVSEATSVEERIAVPVETCPRCHTTTEWGENSWCPDCGYYPIVDAGAADGESWSDALPETPEEVEDTRTALQSIPMWFWAMIAGIVGITLFSVAIRVIFPGEEGAQIRSAVTLIQLTIGGSSAITAHIIATRFAMANDRRINLFDFVIAWFAIWQPTIAALPRTCLRLLSVVWGTIAVITAVTIIGGVDWSAAFRPAHEGPKLKPMKLVGAVAGAAKAQAAQNEDGPTDMGDALGDLAGDVEEMGGDMGGGAGTGRSLSEAFDELGDVEGGIGQMAAGVTSDLGVDGKLSDLSPEELAAKLAETAEKPRHNLECFVYGVVANNKKVPTSFLFAAEVDGVNQHVVELTAADVGKLNYRKLITKLGKAIQKTPEIDTDREAIWVEPVVTCRLSFTGVTDVEELDDAKIEAFVVGQRGILD